MANNIQITKTISLEQYGIKNAKLNYQLSPEELHEITIEKAQGTEVSAGALAVNTGEFTGRSPKDRFIVQDDITKDRVWWGEINIPFSPDLFDALYNKVVNYLSNKEVYVRDCIGCADENYKLNIDLANLNSETKIEVYDVLGKRIHFKMLNNVKSSIIVSNWDSGVYLVKITNDSGTQTKRFVKQ